MQSAPNGINPEEIKTEIEQIKGIENIHHIHIWKLDDVHTFLEAHINLTDNVCMNEMMEIKANAEKLLHEKFSISHITLQMGYKCCDGNNEMIKE